MIVKACCIDRVVLRCEQSVVGPAGHICDVVKFMKVLESNLERTVFDHRAKTKAKLSVLTFTAGVDLSIIRQKH